MQNKKACVYNFFFVSTTFDLSYLYAFPSAYNAMVYVAKAGH